MAVNYKPFSAEFGFKSPGFTVDDEGNITAKTLSLSTDADTSSFQITNAANDFIINDETGTPGITLIKGETYTFSINLDSLLDFNIYQNQTTLYNEGLTFVDAGGFIYEGASAQGKRQGTLTFKVPVDAPDTLYYADGTYTSVGTITVDLPTVVGVGRFEQLTVIGDSLLNDTTVGSTVNSTAFDNGSLVIRGGVGIALDTNMQGSLTVGTTLSSDSFTTNSVTSPLLTSSNDLILNADNEILLQINSTQIGKVDSQGLIIDLRNSNLENNIITDSTINSTAIGETTPSTGKFTNAEVDATPVNNNDVTNKNYVDTQDIAFSIAFGI